jgi:hypothetical protein
MYALYTGKSMINFAQGVFVGDEKIKMKVGKKK